MEELSPTDDPYFHIGSDETAIEASDLTRGRTYSVKKEFVDADGHIHPVGERWHFLGGVYVAYDDMLILYVCKDGKNFRIYVPYGGCSPHGLGFYISNYLDRGV